MAKIETFEELLAYVREGRERFERAEVEWFLRLRDVEQRCMQLIEEAGCATFARFLKSNALCEPARYDAFCRGLERIDESTAREMGTDAVIRLCDVRNIEKVPVVVEAVSAWREEHGGVFPSNETARELVRKCDPREETPKAVKHKSVVAQLQAELQQARAELRVEQHRRKKLETRVHELEQQLASGGQREAGARAVSGVAARKSDRKSSEGQAGVAVP